MSSQNEFPLELDHVIVFVSNGAPEREALHALGLEGWGGDTDHQGLGTASTAFFFDNTYLELSWVVDENLAKQRFGQAGLDIPMRVRWRETGASPFAIGLCWRRPDAANTIPFPTKQVATDSMPPGIFIHLNADHPAEPACIIVPENLEVTFRSFKHKIPRMNHPLGVRKLTNIRITTNTDEIRSPAARLVSQHGIVTIEPGSAALMELTLDGGAQGKSVDARPVLPTVIKC